MLVLALTGCSGSGGEDVAWQRQVKQEVALQEVAILGLHHGPSVL